MVFCFFLPNTNACRPAPRSRRTCTSEPSIRSFTPGRRRRRTHRPASAAASPGWPGTANPRRASSGRISRPRADGGAVRTGHTARAACGSCNPKITKGGDHPVRERELMARACTFGAAGPARAGPAAAIPAVLAKAGRAPPISLLSMRRGRQIRCDKAARAHPDDTSRSFRAAAHVPRDRHAAIAATSVMSHHAPSRYMVPAHPGCIRTERPRVMLRGMVYRHPRPKTSCRRVRGLMDSSSPNTRL